MDFCTLLLYWYVRLYYFTLGIVNFTFRDFVSLSYKKVYFIIYLMKIRGRNWNIEHNEAVLLLLYLHIYM